MNDTGDTARRSIGGVHRLGALHLGALAVLAALFLIGLAAFVYTLGEGTDGTRWGMFTVNLLFLMGVTQAGVAFAAIMRLAKAQWCKVFCRLAEATTVSFLPFAIGGFLAIYGFGREELFYWLSSSAPHHPWLSAPWLLARNLGALLIFYAVSTLYSMMALLSDLHDQAPDLHNQASEEDRNHWLCEKLRSLEIGRDPRRLQRYLYRLSPAVLITFVVANTLIAWDFGMMTIPHWHSTALPIFYWVENLYAGMALLVILAVLLSSKIQGATVISRSAIILPLKNPPLKKMGAMLTGFSLLWLYIYWSQFFVIWFGDLPHETQPLWRQMYGHYSPLFWIMISCAFFLPFGALIFARLKTSLRAMVSIALIINTGIWLNKYLLVMPVLSERHWPFTSWEEFALIVGLLSGFLFVLLLLFRTFPMVSQWELDETR
jgi:molybdopterin-containing oxidoreductase family membrane subunit